VSALGLTLRAGSSLGAGPVAGTGVRSTHPPKRPLVPAPALSPRGPGRHAGV